MKNSKKVISFFMAAIMGLSVFSVTASAKGSNSGYVYLSDDQGYSAQKISHSAKDIKTADGLVDYIGNGAVAATADEAGAGDRAQSYSWSAAAYGDYMYIGTCANAMMTTLSFMKTALGDNFDEETMTAMLNAIFNGHFFIKEEDGADPKGVLIKLNTVTGEVKLLMSKATTGTGCLFRNATVYNDKLYFCGSVNGIPSIYEVDPKTDNCKLCYQSMTAEENIQAYKLGYSVGIRGMCVYKDKLIVSLIGLDGAYICATDTPSEKDSYKVIADMDDLFNYPAYKYCDSIYGGSIWDMVEYNDQLYVTLCTGTPDNKPDENTMQSFALVKAVENEDGTWTWTSVAGDREKYNSKYTYGIDPQRTRASAANLIVYDDYLYIGEYNDEEIALEDILFKRNCNFINANLEQSVNLYRMDKDENVELVMGDADEMFPDGSLTGYGSGFDRNENQYIWRMQEFDDKLYVGTFDTSSLLEVIGQFTNGDIINMSKEEWASQLEFIKTIIDILQKKNDDKAPSPAAVYSIDDENITSEQKKDAYSIVKNETYNDKTLDKLDEIRKSLTELESGLDDNVNQEFVNLYQKIMAELNKIASSSQEIKDLFDKIITPEKLNDLNSFLTCAIYLATAERGFDLFAIDKDLNVTTVTTNGFGDPYNHGCRVFAVTDNGLHIGTANPFYGTQVWHLEENNFLIGDFNEDGIINIIDATEIQKYYANDIALTPVQKIIGDVNDDGIVNILDATEIQKNISEI